MHMLVLSRLSQISLIFCMVAGGFAQTLSFKRMDIPLGDDVQDVVAADFNGDGKMDLAVALYSGSIAILLGNGDGTFGPPSLISGIPSPGQVVAAYVNNDNKLDLVVGAGGSCPFAGPCKFAEDLTSFVILTGAGDGSFSFDTAHPAPTYSRLAAGVFTGAGQALDVFTTGEHDLPPYQNAACFPGLGNGTFGTAAQQSANALGTPFVGDFNKDGRPDVAVGSTLFLGQGGCAFLEKSLLSSGPSFFNQDAGGDLDGDGNLDLVAFDNSGAATVLLGNGDGTFQIPKIVTAVVNGAGGPMVDVNGDGKPDLVYLSFVPTSVAMGLYANANTVSVLLGNGDGTFQTSVNTFATGLNPRKVIAADLNGDGLPDLVTANQDGESITILLSEGTVPLVNESGASFQALPQFAIASIVTATGGNLAVSSLSATTTPLPMTLNGTTVTVKDSSGASQLAPLFYVSAKQVNYEIPPGTSVGTATITVTSGSGVSSSQNIQIGTISPGIFELNSGALAAAEVVTIAADGSQTYSAVYQLDPSNNIVPLPIDVSSGQVYLELFGTGIRNAHRVQVTVAGAGVPSSFGAQSQYVGLDQVNIGPLPRSLEGSGSVNIVLMADGETANTVNVTIK